MSQVRQASYADSEMGRKQTVVVKIVKYTDCFALEEILSLLTGVFSNYVFLQAAYRMCANSNDHIAHFLDSFNGNSIVLRYEEHGCLEEYVTVSLGLD